MKKYFVIIVSGQVQGVSFRSYAKQNADTLKITGYAKNLKDGTVEIIAEGHEQNMQEFIEKIKTGTENAKVENMIITERNNLQNFPTFEVF